MRSAPSRKTKRRKRASLAARAAVSKRSKVNWSWPLVVQADLAQVGNEVPVADQVDGVAQGLIDGG
jgi:hypothetical protein